MHSGLAMLDALVAPFFRIQYRDNYCSMFGLQGKVNAAKETSELPVYSSVALTKNETAVEPFLHNIFGQR